MAAEEYIAHTLELQARVTNLSEEQKQKEKQKNDREVRNCIFKPHDLVILHQNRIRQTRITLERTISDPRNWYVATESHTISGQIGCKLIKRTFQRGSPQEICTYQVKAILDGPSEPDLPHCQTVLKITETKKNDGALEQLWGGKYLSSQGGKRGYCDLFPPTSTDEWKHQPSTYEGRKAMLTEGRVGTVSELKANF